MVVKMKLTQLHVRIWSYLFSVCKQRISLSSNGMRRIVRKHMKEQTREHTKGRQLKLLLRFNVLLLIVFP
jgi:hypothetical protein